MNGKAIRSRSCPTFVAAIVCVTASLPLETRAQEWIVGGAVGTAKQHDYAVGGPVGRRDDTDTAYRLFGGYLVTPIHGVVVSYVDLGTVSYGGPAFGGFTDSLDADGIDVSYVAGWRPGEQERIALFGTAGVFSWKQDVTYTDSTGTFRYRDEGRSLSVGFGTEVNFNAAGSSACAFHAEYQLFSDVGKAGNSGHEDDRDLISVGVDYRFGRRN